MYKEVVDPTRQMNLKLDKWRRSTTARFRQSVADNWWAHRNGWVRVRQWRTWFFRPSSIRRTNYGKKLDKRSQFNWKIVTNFGKHRLQQRAHFNYGTRNKKFATRKLCLKRTNIWSVNDLIAFYEAFYVKEISFYVFVKFYNIICWLI